MDTVSERCCTRPASLFASDSGEAVVHGELKTRLLVVRHGELTTSKEFRFVGHRDVPLNDTGRYQMRLLSDRLRSERVDFVLCSDLQRTMQSAYILAAPHGITPVPNDRFREIDLGHWEGKTMAEIVQDHSEEFESRSRDVARYRISGGESFSDVHARVIPALAEYLENYRGSSIMLVAHGGVNRVILCHFLGLPLDQIVKIDQSYGCLNIIDFFEAGPVVRLVNAVA